jgi:hypothetical protein
MLTSSSIMSIAFLLLPIAFSFPTLDLLAEYRLL